MICLVMCENLWHSCFYVNLADKIHFKGLFGMQLAYLQASTPFIQGDVS
jgi:hypothetical protein